MLHLKVQDKFNATGVVYSAEEWSEYVAQLESVNPSKRVRRDEPKSYPAVVISNHDSGDCGVFGWDHRWIDAKELAELGVNLAAF